MSGTISRTVQTGLPLGVAPRGRLAAVLPLMFPNKNANETLDYAVDFSLEMTGNVAALSACSVVGLPVGPLALTIGAATISGTQVQFTLGGGVAGTNYALTVRANAADGRVFVANVQLYVVPAPAPANPPLPAQPVVPITDGQGDVITTDAGLPVTTA